ncbi:unnamed protein product [Notodromas monacha]|uniref:FAD dependent oxidoreductase domain-containing protein n=1 Tax=Notodromas monacha TaxID=399045 RepID=A0A7R9BQ64_9CRUS|nr:unnamed protein product [Notodromas monacha]CAG0918542.1 unnamed protein product [Notodromas monacha]
MSTRTAAADSDRVLNDICDAPGLDGRKRFDHIIVGAGILGSWTAYHLASRGKYVLLLDQFPLPHSRGSSMGQSRGIELASTDENWIPLLMESYPLWRQLEEETGENLFEYHDLLIITEVAGGWPVPQIDNLLQSFRTRAARRVLDPDQVRKYYPDLHFNNTTAGFVDGSGGILLAAKILNALRGRITAMNGVIKDQCQVMRIDAGPPASVLCRGHANTFTADSVIVTAGPWTSKMLKRVGLDVKIQSSLGAHMYFPAREGASIADISFIHYDTEKRFRAWTHPVVEYPGLVKLGIGLWIPVDPDHRDQDDPYRMREAGIEYVKEHLGCLNQTMAIYETCMYYHIEDKRHIVSIHPFYDNVVVGAAAGSGFKISPVLGKALADLATKRRPALDVSSFSLDRFTDRSNQYYLEKYNGFIVIRPLRDEAKNAFVVNNDSALLWNPKFLETFDNHFRRLRLLKSY